MDDRITITHVIQYADGFVVTLKNLDLDQTVDVFMSEDDYSQMIISMAYTGTPVEVEMRS